jgi:hypothetical protein
MILIPFWDVALGFRTFAVRDFGLYSFPAAAFQRECFWRGQWPLWNPYNCCGLPFLAQFNTLALYPLSLLYLLPPLTWGLPAFCLLHLFLGAMGMYFLARRWTGSPSAGAVAGVVFAFNGLSLNFMMWPSHLATFAWMPWVIWLTEEGWKRGARALIPAALAAAMELLAGGPETILFTWLILLAVALMEGWKSPAAALATTRRFLGTALLALALAAAQLLPFADLVHHGNRTTNFGGSAWSMPLSGWANFLLPLFQTSQWQQIQVQHGQYWTSSYYTGIGIVFLALLALGRNRSGRVRLLGVLLLASLVLALGDSGFVFLWLKRAAPFLGLFRYPVKFVILTVAVLPLLAAFAIAFYEQEQPVSPRSWRAEFQLLAAMLFAVAALLFIARQWPAPNSSWRVTALNAFWRAVFLVATVAALHLFAHRPRWRGPGILLLLALCWGDLLTHEPWQNPTVDPLVFQRDFGRLNTSLDPTPSLSTSRLMMSPFAAGQIRYKPVVDLKANYVLDRITFLDDCNLLDDLPKVDGFFSVYLGFTDKVLRLLDPGTGQQLDRLEDLLSVSQTVAPGKVFDWVARPHFIPIVSIGQRPLFADDQTAIAAIAAIHDDFRQVVYLPVEAKTSVSATSQPDARVLAADIATQRQSIRVTTPAPAMLVLSEAFYHSWQAQIDGQPATLWRANYAFEAVEVPAGIHDVLLTYHDKSFLAGGIIAGVAALICVLGWLLCPGKSQITRQ